MTALLIAPALFLLSASAALLLCRFPVMARWTAGSLGMLGGLGGSIASVQALSTGLDLRVELFRAAPFAPISVRLDPLAAWFLLIISLVALAVCLSGIGYSRVYDHHGGPRLAGLTSVFLASMFFVVLADSAFLFLLAWETMALASFLLVVHEHHETGVGRTGYVYLVMTHIGTGFIVAAFLTLSSISGDLGFVGFKQVAGTLDSRLRDALFLLALVGFGTKAGVIPLHVWLPRAHPVAPSHISALMSGVMLKMGIYGLVRLSWDVLGGGPAWWGAVVLVLGLISAVLGVLYALLERDLKRLLAFSSIENIGIMFIALGAGLSLRALGQPVPAAVALAAGLFHALNHALFKSLLFLGAGAVHQATGTRNLEQLGGLIRVMPVTAGLFLIGSLAISALPPFNGFASEWLTFQALLSLAILAESPWASAGAVLAGGLLGMTGALAAACFVKAFGIGFLGLRRGNAEALVTDAPRLHLAGMALLAVACVVLGAHPGLAMSLLEPVALQLSGASFRTMNLFDLTAIQTPSGALLNPSVLIGALLFVAALAWLLVRAFGPVITRRAPAWVCGFALEPGMQYTSLAFSKPVRLFFSQILPHDRESEPVPGGLPFFPSRIRYRAEVRPVYESAIYRPVMRGLLWSAAAVRGIQSGSLRLYLGYVFATLVLLLVLAR